MTAVTADVTAGGMMDGTAARLTNGFPDAKLGIIIDINDQKKYL